ncbi:restriction endonuclease subunit S [Providencia hangzhouensis]|uniref:restriction endonuclease subunit S n=1 Tax=Providencia hangzhouensis TaxID=3031799 RepID=UPI0034DDA675
MSVEVTETGLNLIPAGYKQTEVGVIPEDWEIFSLGQSIAKTQLGGNYKNSEHDTGQPLIKMGNLDRGFVKLSKQEFIIGNASESDLLNYGDVLFNTRNTLELVGKVAIWKNELPKAYFNSNLMRISFKEDLVSSNLFMNALMNSERFIKALSDIAIGTTSVAAIYNRDLFLIKVALPTKKEQTAIANALSDVDALISELEKLIAKKQAIKTATMQQLLTGRTRLPQFALREDGSKKSTKQSELGEIPEDWEILGLGALFQPSVSKKPIKPKSLVSFVGMQDVTEQAQLSTQHLLAIENVKSGFTYFERGDVLVAKITPCFENGKGCHTETLSTDIGFGSTEFHVLRATDNSDSRFIYYWSNRNVFRKSLESEMVGSAGHRRVPLSAIAKYTIPVPPKEEQTAIATILSDMDDEIQALEQRLGKTRQIKQGMMQELLTGKTRLPYDKE